MQHSFLLLCQALGYLLQASLYLPLAHPTVALSAPPYSDRSSPSYAHLHGKHALHPVNGRRIPIICDAELVDMAFGTGASLQCWRVLSALWSRGPG